MSVLLALALYRSSSYLSPPTSIVLFLSFYCQDYTICRPNIVVYPCTSNKPADMLFVWILYTAILKIRTEPAVRESAKCDPIIRLSVYPDITAYG